VITRKGDILIGCGINAFATVNVCFLGVTGGPVNVWVSLLALQAIAAALVITALLEAIKGNESMLGIDWGGASVFAKDIASVPRWAHEVATATETATIFCNVYFGHWAFAGVVAFLMFSRKTANVLVTGGTTK
jgi:hypothetical protein